MSSPVAQTVACARRNIRHGWAYLIFVAVVVLPLLWMATSLAVRSGMFGLSGAPSTGQVTVFAAFVGGGFGTAATLFGALLTWEHNTRERQRLRLETAVKSLDALGDSPARVAGVLSTMVLLGQERVAIRVLEPAWDRGEVDQATATWLIGQVLAGDDTAGDHLEAGHIDDAAINEAAVLLESHADQLTEDTGTYSFPGHFLHRWTTEKALPARAKDNLLLAMGKMLASRDRTWWCPGGQPPAWPTNVLRECAGEELDPVIRSSAAVLLAAVRDCFPEQFRDHLDRRELDALMARAATAATTGSVPAEYLQLADAIKLRWGAPALDGASSGTGGACRAPDDAGARTVATEPGPPT